MDINYFLINITVIFLFSLILLFITFTFISNRISLLGIYHKLKTEENPYGEPFLKKVVEVVKCNFLLAFPMAFAFYILMIQNIPSSDTQKAILVSMGLSLVTLTIMRIIANPCEYIKPLICERDGQRTEDHLKNHKERMLSFFFAVIGGSALLVLGLFCYNLLQNQSFVLPAFSRDDFVYVFILYTALIILISLVGEIILLIFKPLVTVDFE